MYSDSYGVFVSERFLSPERFTQIERGFALSGNFNGEGQHVRTHLPRHTRTHTRMRTHTHARSNTYTFGPMILDAVDAA